jgi:hypothetical protein
VKMFTRKLGAALMVIGMLGLAGCGPDNETEAQNLGKKLGDPGPANPNAPVVEAKPVTSQLDHFNQTKGGAALQKAGGGAATPKK